VWFDIVSLYAGYVPEMGQGELAADCDSDVMWEKCRGEEKREL
jgi:hypothetical protein